MTAIFPSDPVVFFGNLRYIYNVGSTVTLQPSVNTNATPQRVNIKPGDGIGGSVGMGFGINDKASFSLAYEHIYFMSTSQNGGTIPGSSFDIGNFDLGFAYQVTPRDRRQPRPRDRRHQGLARYLDHVARADQIPGLPIA